MVIRLYPRPPRPLETPMPSTTAPPPVLAAPPVHPSSCAPAYAYASPDHTAPDHTAPGYTAHRPVPPVEPVLPGPNATPATIGTALTVLTAATENILRIDVPALAELITRYGVVVPDEVTRMVEAAATYRGQLLGRLPGPQAQLDRLTAWLVVHAPERLRTGQPLAETIIGMLTEARTPAPGAATRPAVMLPPPNREGRRRGGKTSGGQGGTQGGTQGKPGTALAVVPKTTP